MIKDCCVFNVISDNGKLIIDDISMTKYNIPQLRTLLNGDGADALPKVNKNIVLTMDGFVCEDFQTLETFRNGLTMGMRFALRMVDKANDE